MVGRVGVLVKVSFMFISSVKFRDVAVIDGVRSIVRVLVRESQYGYCWG